MNTNFMASIPLLTFDGKIKARKDRGSPERLHHSVYEDNVSLNTSSKISYLLWVLVGAQGQVSQHLLI